jgi:hypothetical protein
MPLRLSVALGSIEFTLGESVACSCGFLYLVYFAAHVPARLNLIGYQKNGHCHFPMRLPGVYWCTNHAANMTRLDILVAEGPFYPYSALYPMV